MHACYDRSSASQESKDLSRTPFGLIIGLIEQEIRSHFLVLVTCEVGLNDQVPLEP